MGGNGGRLRLWVHGGGDVPTERGKLGVFWRGVISFAIAIDLPIYFWLCAPTTYWLELEYILSVSLNVPQDMKKW